MADYFFCLQDAEALLFFYNPQFYWGSVCLSGLEEGVIGYLERRYAVLTNLTAASLRGAGR